VASAERDDYSCATLCGPAICGSSMWWLMKKKLIFDIGAHKGEDTRFYLRKGFRVVAVEAYPHHAQHIQEQLADDILCGDLVVEQVGIGETRGLGKFYVHETHTDWHRSDISARRANKLTEISVLYIDASSLLAKYEVPYYLKVDIEDADWRVITAISAERKPTFVSFELGQKAEDCLLHLHSIGYKSFQIVNQSKHHETRSPFPACEGNFVNMQFNNYTSGLFGFELPNQWENVEAILHLD
jgi:FkbM family methyltransferase